MDWKMLMHSELLVQIVLSSSICPFVAGGVYRLIAGTSARMQSGPGEVKVLMDFEQDAAGAAEAQHARPGFVPVLPSEAACRSSPQTTCSWVRMERQSFYLIMTD